MRLQVVEPRQPSAETVGSGTQNSVDFDIEYLQKAQLSLHEIAHAVFRVYLAGSWDNWKSRIPLVKSTSDFSTIISLNPGASFLFSSKLSSLAYFRRLRVQISS